MTRTRSYKDDLLKALTNPVESVDSKFFHTAFEEVALRFPKLKAFFGKYDIFKL
ncbi:MAG: hypothetical protein ACRC2S_20825 [Waterburya sp.]